VVRLGHRLTLKCKLLLHLNSFDIFSFLLNLGLILFLEARSDLNVFEFVKGPVSPSVDDAEVKVGVTDQVVEDGNVAFASRQVGDCPFVVIGRLEKAFCLVQELDL